MSRKVQPFIAPEPRRAHGLSPAAFLATRLSEASSMVFGFAVVGNAHELILACEKAQVALDRIVSMTSQLLDQPSTTVPGTTTKE